MNQRYQQISQKSFYRRYVTRMIHELVLRCTYSRKGASYTFSYSPYNIGSVYPTWNWWFGCWVSLVSRREGVADGTTGLNGCNIPKLFGADFIVVDTAVNQLNLVKLVIQTEIRSSISPSNFDLPNKIRNYFTTKIVIPKNRSFRIDFPAGSTNLRNLNRWQMRHM